MAKRSSLTNFISLLIGIALSSDNWSFLLFLREFGTKPVMLILYLYLLAILVFEKKIIINKKGTLFSLIFILLIFFSIKLNGLIILNQSVLFISSILIISCFNRNLILNPKLIVYSLLFTHVFFFIGDVFIDINFFRDQLTFVDNINPKPRGLFSEHSYASMVLAISPFFINKKFILFKIAIHILVLYTIIFTLDSGTGLITYLCALFVNIIFNYKFHLKYGIFTFLPFLLITCLTLVLLIQTRLNINYNESNATRLLIPYFLIGSFTDNFYLGVGIGGQLNYLKLFAYGELIQLTEFQNSLYDKNINRFNSFNLYVRLISSFGLIGVFVSLKLLNFINSGFKLIQKNMELSMLSVLALISSLSNDSFNNPYLIIVIILVSINSQKEKNAFFK